MNIKDPNQLLCFDLDASGQSYGTVILNRDRFVEILTDILNIKDTNIYKNKLTDIKNTITNFKKDDEGILNIEANGDTIALRKDVLLSEINQILDSLTRERADYYLRRLIKGVQKIKTNKINDINLLRWKEYDNIITDSLWILNKRDTSGAHLGWYWGNFIPQIPNQLMLRYTKKGDWVVDPFAGSGTTLIECKRLGRNGIGIELNEEVAKKAKELISLEPNKHNVITDIINGDSATVRIGSLLNRYSIDKYQLLLMHPPYHNIIKFSSDTRDLSNTNSIRDFLNVFGKVVDNFTPYLDSGRYLALVIGDKYSKGEWIPLGYYCMNEVMKRNYSLKSIIVKNFDETRAKRNQQELWRYRALVGGFYVFKHEYIMLFKKK
ncbi:MAG: TRM11 family SAM-dependent methyltransferase [Verrucomicrobiia bacterium]